MSDTPDTDAFITSQDYSPTGHQWRNFTRKLERERDEARATIEDAKRALNATDYEGILLAALRVKEERDEAKELLAKALIRGDLALEETKKAQEALHWSDIQDKRELQRERDKEAKDQLHDSLDQLKKEDAERPHCSADPFRKWKWMMDYCKCKGMSPTLGWGSAEEAFLKTIGKWEDAK